MNNVNLQIYSFGFDCGLSFLDKIRKAGSWATPAWNWCGTMKAFPPRTW